MHLALFQRMFAIIVPRGAFSFSR